MTLDEFKASARAYMEKEFGYGEAVDEFPEWFERDHESGAFTPEESAEGFGVKYDLARSDDWTMSDAARVMARYNCPPAA